MATACMYSTYHCTVADIPQVTLFSLHFARQQDQKISKKMALQSSNQAHRNSKYALPNNEQININGKGKRHSEKAKSSMIHIWLDPQVLENR